MMGKVIMSGIVPQLAFPTAGTTLSVVAEGSTVTLQAASYTVTKQSGTSTTLTSEESGEEVTLPGTAVLNDDGSVTT